MRKVEKGRLKVFQRPQPGLRYAIGCDVAEGLELGDFSTAFVIDSNYNQCATWCGHIDPDLFGRHMAKLARHYNNALLAIEINNHGHAAAAAVKNAGYNNVFVRLIKEQRSEAPTKKIGWQTNSKTKMLMLDEFVAMVRDETINLRDDEIIKEMMALTVEPDGNVNLNGKDRVVSACIAIQALKQAGDTYKAFIPNTDIKKPRSIEEKIKYYNQKRNKDSYYE